MLVTKIALFVQLWVITIAYRYDNETDPVECKLFFWLASKDSLDTKTFNMVDHSCVDHFIEKKNVESYCLNNPDVCHSYARNYAHKVTPEMNRRILKGTGSAPAPTNPPSPTPKPTLFPTLSPSKSPTRSPTVGEEEINSLFFKYPNDLCVDVEADFGSDYELVDVDNLILSDRSPVSYDDLNIRNQVLTKYRFGPRPYAGFIFSGEKLMYIVNRRKMHYDMDFKLPEFIRNNFTFYERRFINKERGIYIDKNFGYVNHTAEGYHRRGAETYVLLSRNNMTINEKVNMEETCDKIPRCLGYIPSIGLISSLARRRVPSVELIEDIGDEFTISDYYMEKQTRHQVFVAISRNSTLTIFLWIASFILAIVLVFYGNSLRSLRGLCRLPKKKKLENSDY